MKDLENTLETIAAVFTKEPMLALAFSGMFLVGFAFYTIIVVSQSNKR